MRTARTVSKGIANSHAIEVFLGMPVCYGLKGANGDDLIIGWGMKENTLKARAFAHDHKLSYLHLEDGFLGFMSHPSIDARRMSIVGDRHGIYYDATRPSDIEVMLSKGGWMTPELAVRAKCIIDNLRKYRISKYNHAGFDLPVALQAALENDTQKKVLVVDQTYGDKSIELGHADGISFKKMFESALSDNPDALILVKTHPDVILGKKKGHFNPNDKALKSQDRIVFIGDDCNPQALMQVVDHVYVVTSQMGLEALIAGKPVTCFGMPFYAGWGLTTDKVLCLRRTRKFKLEELVAAAFIKYPRYVDPFTQRQVDVEDILDLLIAEKQIRRPVAQRAIAVGFSLWKRGFIAKFFGAGVRSTKFINPKALANFKFKGGDVVILWGRKHDKEAASVDESVPIWRMEDGFLRSVGLGSDLRRPSSLVLDQQGIYYDGSGPSDLEKFLEQHSFSEREITRGRKLRKALLKSRLSKYNVGERGQLDFRGRAGGKHIILVPGQVEGDASLEFGSPDVFTNADLVKAAHSRAANDHPEGAYVIYKPHPDVISGNREGVVPDKVLDVCVDEIVTDADIIDCLEAVDSVHTMTSLTGFEALLRGVPVTTYGMPFYAGWGLTHDVCKNQRFREVRGKAVPIDGLVYALLCVYARYVSWEAGGQASSPEALIASISEEAKRSAGRQISRRGLLAYVGRLGRKVKYLFEGVFS
jgi:capsular polysaccharide export protein